MSILAHLIQLDCSGHVGEMQLCLGLPPCWVHLGRRFVAMRALDCTMLLFARRALSCLDPPDKIFQLSIKGILACLLQKAHAVPGIPPPAHCRTSSAGLPGWCKAPAHCFPASPASQKSQILLHRGSQNTYVMNVSSECKQHCKPVMPCRSLTWFSKS